MSNLGKRKSKKQDFKVSAALPAPSKNLSTEQGLLFSGQPGKCAVFFPLLGVAELVGTGGVKTRPCFADLKGCSIYHTNLFVQAQFGGSFVC